MEVRKGYKQTEVGVIPEDWEVYEFEKIGIPSNTKINPKISGGGTVCIELEHINQGSGSINETTITTFNSSIKSVFCPNDILFGKLRAYLRKYYLADFKGVCSTEIWVIKPASDEIHFKFLYQIVQSHKFINVSSEAYGTHMPRSDWNIVKKSKFGIPPTKAEQTAIATALSDVDALITQLEKLITKKRHIKQGAMQTLLNPFDENGSLKDGWEEKMIQDIVSTPVTDGPHETPNFTERGVPFLSVNNIVNNKINYSNLRYISKKDDLIYSKKCKPQLHDILLGKAASVGKVAIVETNQDFNIWSPLALIRVKSNYSPYFIFLMFQTKLILSQIETLTNASSQGNIGMVDIKKIKIPYIGGYLKQKTTASIFIDMDLEITALETKLAKTKKLKQGMMQSLLTGQIRLVDPTPTPKNEH